MLRVQGFAPSGQSHSASSRYVKCQGTLGRRQRLPLPNNYGFLLPDRRDHSASLYGPGLLGFQMMPKQRQQQMGLIQYVPPNPLVKHEFQEASVVLYEGDIGLAELTVYAVPIEANDSTLLEKEQKLLGPPTMTAALPSPRNDVAADFSCNDSNSSPVGSESSSNNVFVGQQQSPRRTLRIQFTCNRCKTRNVNQVNPLAWHQGTVFIQCGGCGVRHKMVDHLGIVHELQGSVFAAQQSQEREDKLRAIMPEHMLPKS